jgi:hypothetical protein
MQWKAFLSNHREVIAAMDFFTVPTLRFSVLYCFFVIACPASSILSHRIDSPYLLLSSGWLPHRECYPAWSSSHTLEGGDEEKN